MGFKLGEDIRGHNKDDITEDIPLQVNQKSDHKIDQEAEINDGTKTIRLLAKDEIVDQEDVDLKHSLPKLIFIIKKQLKTLDIRQEIHLNKRNSFKNEHRLNQINV